MRSPSAAADRAPYENRARHSGHWWRRSENQYRVRETCRISASPARREQHRQGARPVRALGGQPLLRRLRGPRGEGGDLARPRLRRTRRLEPAPRRRGRPQQPVRHAESDRLRGLLLVPQALPSEEPYEVVQGVPAGRGLLQQPPVDQQVQGALGGRRVLAGQDGGELDAGVMARDQGESAQQQPVRVGELAVGEGEGAADGEVARHQAAQPALLVGELAHQPGRGPARAAGEAVADDPQGQREVAAQLGQPGDRLGLAVGARGAEDPPEEPRRLPAAEPAEPDPPYAFETGQRPSAGDQHETALGVRQQRPGERLVGRVVQDDQGP